MGEKHTGWQPIETAPAARSMEDDHIIVWGPQLKCPEVVLPDGDWWRYRLNTDGSCLFTHWMQIHLPATPTDTKPAGEGV